MNTTLLQEQNTNLLHLENQELRNEIKLLKEQLEWLKRKLLGKSSERFVADPADTLYLPGLGPETAVLPNEEEIEVPSYKKRKAKSTPINTITYPDDLPVETQILELCS